jgi:hypothetical protein
MSDPDSKVFYVLRDEQLMLCRTLKELPYWQNRATYLSAGRFSKEYRKVVFYPDPVNPARAMQLLKEHGHIGEDFNYAIAGSTTRAPKTKKKGPVEKLGGVRKRQVEVLMDRGMKRQTREVESDETQESETST